MNNMTIEFQVENQILSRTDSQRIVEDSVNYLYAHFTFSEDWADTTKAIIVENKKVGLRYKVYLNEQDTCKIPNAIVDYDGFSIIAVGENESNYVTITTSLLFVSVLMSNFTPTEEADIKHITSDTLDVRKDGDMVNIEIPNIYFKDVDFNNNILKFFGRDNELLGQVEFDYGRIHNITIEIDNTNYIFTLKAYDKTNTLLFTRSADFNIEGMLIKSASYDSATQELVLVFQNGNVVRIPISDILTGIATEDWVRQYFVAKENGKGLSTNDYTNEDKSKLGGIEAGAEVNVQSDWNENDSSKDGYIKNKPYIPTKTSDLQNDSGFIDNTYHDSTKQDVIDSSHKLNSDLVDDDNATHKFVSQEEKTQITKNKNDITSLQSNKADLTNSTQVITADKVKLNEIRDLSNNVLFDKTSKVKLDNAYGPTYVGEDTSVNILAKTSNTGILKATDNNHWYYWNGAQYVDGGVYQETQIADGSIVASMLAESLTPFGGEIGSSPTAPYNDANTFPNKNATYRINDVSAVSNLPTSSGSGILITKLGISSNNAVSCQLFITSDSDNRKPNLYIRSKYNQWSSWTTLGIDGEAIGSTSSYTSANDLPYNKVFRLNNDNILTDLPTNNYAVFYRYNFNERDSKDVSCDFFVDVNTQKFYYRTRFINTYSSWKELLTTNDINFIIAKLTTDYTITQGAFIWYQNNNFEYVTGHDSLSLYEKDIRQYQNQEIDVWFNADSVCYTVMIDGTNSIINSVQSNGQTYQKYRMFVPKSAVKIQISCRDSIPRIEKATINTLPVIENINSSFHPASIFHDWAFIGDSLTQGAIQAIPEGQTEEVGVVCDAWSYPANIERKLNINRTMYAVSGAATPYIYETFKNDFLTVHKEIYIIGMGQNDKYYADNHIDGYSWGNVATDINDSDYTQNANSYAGYMGRIIQSIRTNNPKCYIFVMPTLMQWGYSADCMTVLNDLCSHFDRVYLLDNTQYWKYWRGWTDGHLDAIGYNFVADYVINSIDKIIIDNESEFRNVPFIFTNYEAGL